MKLSKNFYILPVLEDDLETISSDSDTHVNMDAFAIDFVLPEGCVVRAAAPGKIIFMKTDSNLGGDDIKFENFKYYNHIIVKHNDGEYTEYGHLQFNGSAKNLGDKVNEGEIIGYSGNTGYSEKPHLHFSVFRLNNMSPDFEKLPKNKAYFINDKDFGFETIKPKFKK